MRCDRCREEIPKGEDWPGAEGTICQVCWEADCAESFWEFAALLAPTSEGET